MLTMFLGWLGYRELLERQANDSGWYLYTKCGASTHAGLHTVAASSKKPETRPDNKTHPGVSPIGRSLCFFHSAVQRLHQISCIVLSEMLGNRSAGEQNPDLTRPNVS